LKEALSGMQSKQKSMVTAQGDMQLALDEMRYHQTNQVSFSSLDEKLDMLLAQDRNHPT
jgi:hypothetical protein